MDNEFPSNSRRPGREEKKPETKKVEAVVTGEVVRRKKPLGTRLLETFIGGTARNVAQHIMMDILVPAAKDTIADAVSQGVERLIFGEAQSSSRRTGYRPSRGGTTNYTSYNRFSSTPSGSALSRREEPRRVTPTRGPHNFDQLILATRVEADEVIERMFDLLQKYELVSVADLLGLVGEQTQFTDEKWGWTDLRGAGATRIRDGYLLDLPQPEPLD